ncbi:hypothetical protein H4582DRAFT_2073297 [Lactarius indigo]|nr:hypothetical protein H4582DRAFT_2073297 [Lactarius indigo]
MRTPTQIRRYCVTALSGRHRDGSSQIPVLQGTSTPTTSTSTPRHALPRKIAQGVFFVDPTSGDRDATLSTRTLVDLGITHAGPTTRSPESSPGCAPSGGSARASSSATSQPAAGYLVVELSLTPRSAWLRIARGIPPAGDLVLAKLCALALTHSAKDEAEVVSRSADSELDGGHVALIKLDHSLAGIYIWETVFTVGFELDVLRGKRPYKWTIWPYLGTRYFGLAAFIVFFVDTDGGKVALPIANYVRAQHRSASLLPTNANISHTQALPYVSWAFASLIIVIRVIAIWNRQIIMSSIAVATWLAGLGLNIRNLTMCIIWIVLAGIAEIPPVVFLILNFNDPWNEMFTGVAITILSIGAARMYRALSERGSITEYSSQPPRNPSGLPFSTFQSRDPYNVRSPMHFAPAGTMSRSEGTTTEAPVFVPADEIQVEFVPGASAASLAVPPKTQSKDVVAYQTVQLRPG